MIGSRCFSDYRPGWISRVACRSTPRSWRATANSWRGDIAGRGRPLRSFPAMPVPNYKPLLGIPALLAGLGFAVEMAFAPSPYLPRACVPEVIAEDAVADPLDQEQRKLAAHLARRFQVGADGAGTAVFAAYRAARDVGLDPLLVLAMIAVESSFNPEATSSMGAKG